MGLGYFVKDGFVKVSYFRNFKIVDLDNSFVLVQDIKIFVENINCYDIKSFYDSDWGYYFYYGGFGRNFKCF